MWTTAIYLNTFRGRFEVRGVREEFLEFLEGSFEIESATRHSIYEVH